LVSMETDQAKAVPEESLLNGAYQWRVEAFNADGTKIAQTAEFAPFKVAGQAGSNSVDLLFPKQDSVVPAAGVKLQWKSHPLAEDYRVYVKGVAAKDPVVAFESQAGVGRDLPALAPDQYFWAVEAHKGGEKIAASELKRFRVK
jgi:hypothetical protein